ncbi:MAG: hypothetical protein KF855_11790 [Acidobacteria bacterium]|nr:hypothetical protein [Acidobacteriota bacterium]
MRKLQRENIISKINKDPDEKQGRSVHVRPYESDEKMLDEIADKTGEAKAAIVRRMIRFALSDKYEHFSANPCRDRLDLLVEQSRQDDDGSERIAEILDRIRQLEDDQRSSEQKRAIFLREIYSLSGLSVFVLNILLSRMIELTMPKDTDKEKIVHVANGTMKNVIAQTILDLDRCLNFHGIDSGPQILDELYFATRLQGLAPASPEEPIFEPKPL